MKNEIVKAVVSAMFVLLLGLIMVIPVMADGGQYGQYGGGVETPSEQPKEEITHETIEAGIEDVNFSLVAVGMASMAFTFIIVSRVTQRVYLLD